MEVRAAQPATLSIGCQDQLPRLDGAETQPQGGSPPRSASQHLQAEAGSGSGAAQQPPWERRGAREQRRFRERPQERSQDEARGRPRLAAAIARQVSAVGMAD